MPESVRLPEEVPSAAEFGLLIAYLATRGSESAQQLRNILGSGPDGRSRREIAGQVRDWLRER